jgi:hypothetical protein
MLCTEFLHAPLVPSVCAFISKNWRPERSIPFYECSRFAAIQRFITGRATTMGCVRGKSLEKLCAYQRRQRDEDQEMAIDLFYKIGLFKDVADSSPQVLLQGSAE